MSKQRIVKYARIILLSLALTACIPTLVHKTENKSTPANFGSTADSTSNSGKVNWRSFYTDSNLVALIDSALKNNQELNIVMQEIVVANNEVRSRKAAYLPFLNVGVGA